MNLRFPLAVAGAALFAAVACAARAQEGADAVVLIRVFAREAT